VADLVARPIGIKVLRPAQTNRAFDIVERKFRRSPAGEVKGWGLKVFP
jgi:RNase P/RNase MRP subunit p30